MPITPQQLEAMQARLAPKVRLPVPEDAVDNEGGLHNEIIEWIRSQHPQPAYIHARMDRKSTINKGAVDFCIFWKGRVLLIECKTRTNKRTPAQLGWALLAEMNGFHVYECRSMTEFRSIINQTTP